jgi:hypothetical protein
MARPDHDHREHLARRIRGQNLAHAKGRPMKSRISWKRLSGSTKTKIKSMLSRGWRPDRSLSQYLGEQRRHRTDECDTPPVTAGDLALIEGNRA